MRSLHIVMVIPGFSIDRIEPGLPSILDLVERVAQQHRVSIVALHYPKRRRVYRLAGARVVPLSLRKGIGLPGRAIVQAVGLAEVLRQSRRAPVDVVHALWADEPGAVAVVSAALLRARALVSVLGGELVAMPEIRYGTALGRGGRWTARVALRQADVVTVGSSYLQRQVLETDPDAAPELCPLGVDTSLFSPAPAGESRAADEQTVLLVGALMPVKDPAAAVRVFARVAATRPRARLALYGEGRLRPRLEAFIDQLGLTGRVELRGQVPRRQLPEIYRSAAAVLVTSRHEGQHVAAIEAAASGVPVVGYAVGALPDLGEGAIVRARGDERGLASALARVLDDPGEARRVAAAGRATAVARYDVNVTSERFLDIYARLARRA